MVESYHEIRLKRLLWHQKIFRSGIFVFLILVSLQTKGIDASEADQSNSYLDATWNIYESIKAKFYDIYSASIPSNRPLKSDLIDSGLKLLKIHHDPSGAEAICKAAVKESPNKIDAWICLGESQLLLHNNAWSRNNQGAFVFQKLSDAMYSFNQAMTMDATNPRVRLDLGLAMYLTAIRDVSQDAEEVSQLLFDSVNHFQAAASLTSPLDCAKSDPEKDRIHIASMYNVGLAYLALGDPSSSIPFFRKVASTTNTRIGMSVAAVNLSTAIAQKGRFHDSLDELHNLSLEFCHFDHQLKDIDLDELAEAKMMKLCSLIRNNLGQASGKYIAIAEPDIKISGTPSITAPRTHLIVSDETHTESISEKRDTINLISSFDDAIIALETALTKDPKNFHLLISLSKAKLRNGDHKSAVESAISALNVASNTHEVNRASEALDLALNVDYQNTDSKNNVQFLKYEQELLSLKTQILGQAWTDSSSPESTGTSESDVLSQSKDTSDSKTTIIDEQSNGDNQRIDRDINNNEHEEQLKIKIEEYLDESIVSDTIASPSMSDQPGIHVQKLERKEFEVLNNAGTKNEDMTEHEISIDEPKNATTDNSESRQSIDEPKNATTDDSESRQSIDEPKNATTDNSESRQELDVSKHDEVLPSDEPIMNIAKSDFQSINSTHSESLKEPHSTVQDETHNDTVEDFEKSLETEVSKANASPEPLMLQPLFQPDKIMPEEVCPTSLSYMKMADAYMQNGNFKAANKQFQKVLKKTAYSHIPALLGYATCLERLESPNTAIAYANVTYQALTQDMEPLATASLQRAIASAKTMNTEKLKILRHLLTICFTNKFAADVHFEIGQELAKISGETDLIIDSYMRANAYSTLDGGTIHAPSLLELAKIAFAQKRYESSFKYIDMAMTQTLGSREVEAQVYLGRIKENLSDSEGARVAFEKAIELPLSDASADAFYYFGLHLKANGGNEEDIKGHIEKALNLGFDLTTEATEILGEHNMSVIKSAHRAEWQRYQDMAKQEEQRGGIMSGGNISGNSIFSQQESSNSEVALNMLEQGAASYDGSSIPIDDDSHPGATVNPALSRSKVF
jgi:tetratricopeptide (TPR) repeat protein